MLQRKGRVTAAQVAAEFEVSERTARRDLEALGIAGFPVYSVQGRGGGWRLLGRGRTDLSGLSGAEVRALFLLAGSALGTGSGTVAESRSALRKLVSALPEPLQDSAETASRALVIDPRNWDTSVPEQGPGPEYLDAVQLAVIEQRELELGYVKRTGERTSRRVQPLGLVAKSGNWYLVADTAGGLRTFRLDRVVGADQTGRPADRPDDFDLATAWALVIDRVQDLRLPVAARCRVELDVMRYLRFVVGDRLVVGEKLDDHTVEVEIRGHALASLAADLAGFGARVQVLDPPELGRRLGEIGRDLARLYG